MNSFRIRCIKFMLVLFLTIVAVNIFLVKPYMPVYGQVNETGKNSELIKKQKGAIRVATWNIRKMGKNKRDKKYPNTSTTIGEQLLKIIRESKIDLIAFQEVKKEKDLEFLQQKNTNKYREYKLIPGSSISNSEFCPILYNEKKIELVSLPNNQSTSWRGKPLIHWEQFKLKKQNAKEFYFGCTHFSPTKNDKNEDIHNFFEALSDKKNQAKFIGQTQKQSFILGLDANSNYHNLNHEGKKHKTTEEWHKESDKLIKNAGIKISFIKIKGFVSDFFSNNLKNNRFDENRAFTHFSKSINTRKKNRFEVNGQIPIKDDLIWFIPEKNSPITYLTNTKKVIPLFKIQKLEKEESEFWKNYDNLSDHLPVIADFE